MSIAQSGILDRSSEVPVMNRAAATTDESYRVHIGHIAAQCWYLLQTIGDVAKHRVGCSNESWRIRIQFEDVHMQYGGDCSIGIIFLFGLTRKHSSSQDKVDRRHITLTRRSN